MPSPHSLWLRYAGLLLSCVGVLLPARAQDTVGELFASDARVKGAVVLAAGGTKVMSGSSVSAGEAAALLKLARGGEVRVCPRTTISVSTSPSGRDLMLGMGEGAIEANYSLAASADSILTPDFRILLAGPGGFHFAVGVDGRGNTCMRALAGNGASLIVSELMGDGTYQVRPGEEVMFRGGRVSHPEPLAAAGCGCPAPLPPVVRATAPPPPPSPTPPSVPEPPQPPAAAALNEIHVQVDAPFVFRAADLLPPPVEVAQLRLSRAPQVPLTVLPPQPQISPGADSQVATAEPPKKPGKRGFFGKVRAFFAAIFR